MIKIKLDLMKIDKELLFNAESGAVYFDGVLIETPNSPHNDYMVVQDLPKDRREAGEKSPIIGNASRLVPKATEDATAESSDEGTKDDLPF